MATDASFLQWERDWVINWCLADFEVRLEVNAAPHLDGATVIISSGTADRMTAGLRERMRVARARGIRIAVIHLSDEYAAHDLSFYNDCDVVLRNYFRRGLRDRTGCSLFPLGYRSGFLGGCTSKPFGERPHRWAFAGQAKGDRRVMLEWMSKWHNGSIHLTEQWDDPRALGPNAYAQLVSDAQFVPCPRGNCSMESFRFYEALEAGALPLVEDLGGGWHALQAWIVRRGLRAAIGPGGRRRASEAMAESYWCSLFGRDFPVPRIAEWADAPRLLGSLNVAAISDAVQIWWISEKQRVRTLFRSKLQPLIVEAVSNPAMP